jgi:hypothetical protein
VLKIAEQSQFYDNLLLSYPLAVLLVRALMREFARASQAIIHPALKIEKTPRPLGSFELAQYFLSRQDCLIDMFNVMSNGDK